MSRGPLIFLLAFFALAASWSGLVLAPQLQLSRQIEGRTVPMGEVYPRPRPGLAAQGREVYRANGCATCHSQQVRQTGVEIGVAVTKADTNLTELVEVLVNLNLDLGRNKAARLVRELPQQVLTGMALKDADRARRQIEVTGAKALVTVQPTGPDLERGWGKRRSVAADFLTDFPVMPGSQRVGPDLANLGARMPNKEWLLWHLYNPRIVTAGSMMPPYPYLFEKRRIGHTPSPDALRLPDAFKPEAAFEIVPKPEATALVAYLLSLNASAQLFETPMSLPIEPVAATNAVESISGRSSNSPAAPNP